MFKWKREQIEHLIICIKQNPCIYNVKCIDYLDRVKKTSRFNFILQEMQKMERTFTLFEIKRKWRILRTQYAHELRAINMAQKCGNTYEPKLWCFKQLEFLEMHIELKANKDSTEVNEPPKIQKKEKIAVNPDELLELATKRLKRSDDYSQTLANVWANEFRLASEEQQFFAKKAIDDILFEARLGTLHRNSVKINSNPEVLNTYDSPIEPSRITSSPNSCTRNQTAYPQYIVHLPNQSKRSYNNSQPVKNENYNVSYVEENDLISIEPEINIRSEGH